MVTKIVNATVEGIRVIVRTTFRPHPPGSSTQTDILFDFFEIPDCFIVAKSGHVHAKMTTFRVE